ncbi:MAG: glycoside hydrolase family 3 C-terminal domain-containing protein [Saccharofermentans sp.]|nr:glycoside hydrolase family 3 C-terminal domain-containing protein [Saccharofermentans sp.]
MGLNIDAIISSMSLEEKALLLCGETFFRTRKLEKYSIPHMQLLDGGTGMNFEQLISDWYRDFVDESKFNREQLDNVSKYFYEVDKLSSEEKELKAIIEKKMMEKLGSVPPPGCYPPGILLGSTWNRELVYEVGDALGMEARQYQVDCLLGTPNINLLREPRNGRFFEGYSEDPYLAGELGSQLVKGVEGRGVASDVKHFAANNLEKNRIGIDQHISYRALEEMYLPAFEKCARAGAATFMTSYPSINGKPCTRNPWLLRDVLRDRFEFEGLNMSDWGACTGDAGDSVEAGMDLFMPGPWPHEGIIKAVEEKRLSVENLDLAVRHMLEFVDKYSHELNVNEKVSPERFVAIGDAANYKAASEGIVLLKNNGILPIKESTNVMLFGEDKLRIYGDGSAQVYTSREGKFSDYIINKADDEATLNDENTVALVVCTMGSGEGKDKENLKVDLRTRSTLDVLTGSKRVGNNIKIILVLNVSGPVEISEWVDDIDAIITTYYPGGEGCHALMDILYGRVNPSGHLSCTWPVRYEDTPAYLCYPDGYHCNYGEDIYVGYRGYQKRDVKPLFCFGHGLSYSSFDLNITNIDKHLCKLNETITLSYSITNTGNMDGAQVVQLYVTDKVSRVGKPLRELKGFDKVFVKAGETISKSISISVNNLASYDDDLMKWIVEDGEYELALGFDCDHMEAQEIIRVVDGSPEYRLGLNMTIDELQKYPQLRQALVNSIATAGDDIMSLIMTERYIPATKIKDALPNSSAYHEFIKCCDDYLKD